MLEKYRQIFPDFYEHISKSIINNKINHAYLIDVGNVDNYISIIKDLVIEIFSNENRLEIDYSKLVDNDSFSDFKVISPNNSIWIKKEQILNLQSAYKIKSVYNNKKIYVIDKADDLNLAAANTLLKFLEEPSDDIVGILITKNKYNIIPTIVSRCQILKIDATDNQSNTELKEIVVNFFELIDSKKETAITYLKKINYDLFNKDNITMFFDEVLCFYNDLCRCILNTNLINYSNYLERLKLISNNTNIKEITDKILKINDICRNLKFNINTRLIMDKLVLIMVGVDVNV